MKYIFSMFTTTYSLTSYSLHSSYVLVSVLYMELVQTNLIFFLDPVAIVLKVKARLN